MIFWDSSAIVPLLVEEEETDYCLKALSEDQEMLIWCLSGLEVMSALCRRVREGSINERYFQATKRHLKDFVERAYEIKAIEQVKQRAVRLLEVHPLCATDACQLASALVATHEDPDRLVIVSFDQRLKTAAIKEGFIVNPIEAENKQNNKDR